MKAEQRYYELPGLWTPGPVSAAERERINATTRLLPSDAQGLLDVGCGNGLFVNHLLESGRFAHGSLWAVDRSRAALQHVRTRRVLGSVESLPFPARTFDAVTCLEVIEHLPVHVYASALAELARVASRYVVITVPYREDREATAVTCPSCGTRFSPYFHLRSFDETTLRTILQPFGFRCEELRGLVHTRDLRFSSLVKALRSRRPTHTSPGQIPVSCPVCDFELPPDSALGRLRGEQPNGGSPAHGRSGRGLVKALWPRYTRPAWMGVVCRRTA